VEIEVIQGTQQNDDIFHSALASSSSSSSFPSPSDTVYKQLAPFHNSTSRLFDKIMEIFSLTKVRKTLFQYLVCLLPVYFFSSKCFPFQFVEYSRIQFPVFLITEIITLFKRQSGFINRRN
jgi:hypothetical protein